MFYRNINSASTLLCYSKRPTKNPDESISIRAVSVTPQITEQGTRVLGPTFGPPGGPGFFFQSKYLRGNICLFTTKPGLGFWDVLCALRGALVTRALLSRRALLGYLGGGRGVYSYLRRTGTNCNWQLVSVNTITYVQAKEER